MWVVDLEAGTATHKDGWVLQFQPVPGEPGAFDGKCIAKPANLPSPLPKELMPEVSRICREAGDAFMAARAGRH